MYKAIASYHDDFAWMVVREAGGAMEEVCHTYTLPDAERIADGLNLLDRKSPGDSHD